MYLTTATLHNPTGGSLAPAKAYRLLKLCEAAGTWVVEDDTYGDLAMHPVWGIGLDARHANATHPTRWKGLNLLGFALMDVRAAAK